MAVLTVHPPVAEGAGQEVEAEMKWVCVVVCDVCDQLVTVAGCSVPASVHAQRPHPGSVRSYGKPYIEVY